MTNREQIAEEWNQRIKDKYGWCGQMPEPEQMEFVQKLKLFGATDEKQIATHHNACYVAQFLGEMKSAEPNWATLLEQRLETSDRFESIEAFREFVDEIKQRAEQKRLSVERKSHCRLDADQPVKLTDGKQQYAGIVLPVPYIQQKLLKQLQGRWKIAKRPKNSILVLWQYDAVKPKIGFVPLARLQKLWSPFLSVRGELLNLADHEAEQLFGFIDAAKIDQDNENSINRAHYLGPFSRTIYGVNEREGRPTIEGIEICAVAPDAQTVVRPWARQLIQHWNAVNAPSIKGLGPRLREYRHSDRVYAMRPKMGTIGQNKPERKGDFSTAEAKEERSRLSQHDPRVAQEFERDSTVFSSGQTAHVFSV